MDGMGPGSIAFKNDIRNFSVDRKASTNFILRKCEYSVMELIDLRKDIMP